jgi:hypothetical protein
MPMMNHRGRLRIGNISRSYSEQPLHSADHAANGTTDHRTDGACGKRTIAPPRNGVKAARLKLKEDYCRAFIWT